MLAGLEVCNLGRMPPSHVCALGFLPMEPNMWPEHPMNLLLCLSFSPRDGIPPYRVGSKKQLQREMHRSVKANGQVSLPHFPVSVGEGRRIESGWEFRASWGGKEMGSSCGLALVMRIGSQS